jgi:hypothetical protein
LSLRLLAARFEAQHSKATATAAHNHHQRFTVTVTGSSFVAEQHIMR